MNRAITMQSAGKALTVAVMAASAVGAARAEEQTEVQKKTAELEQQTALLNAQTALLKAKWPVFEGGHEGKLSKGTSGMYSLGAWSQVYDRFSDAADDVCKAVKAAPSQQAPVLLVEADLDAAMRYRVVAKEQKVILDEINRLASTAVPVAQSSSVEPSVAPLVAAGAILPSLISLTKLFRTDVALTDEPTTITDRTLADLLYERARETHGLALVYPQLASLLALSGAQTTSFSLDVDRIIEKRGAVQRVIDDSTNTAKSAQATALLARMDKYVADLYATPSGGGRAPIAEALHGEAVDGAVKNSQPILLVRIVQQGGNSMVTSNAWREDRLYVGGGAVVAYKLIDKGKLLASGTVRKVDPQFKQVLLSR